MLHDHVIKLQGSVGLPGLMLVLNMLKVTADSTVHTLDGCTQYATVVCVLMDHNFHQYS